MLPRLAAVVVAAFAVTVSTTYAGNQEHKQSAHTLRFVSNHVNGILRSKCLPTYLDRRVKFQTLIRRHALAHRAKTDCSRWTRADADFHSALHLAASTFGVSYSWLHACDHSEGSDRMVPNSRGSGAFGPMQFMSGTFYGSVYKAFALARSRGVYIPMRYARWNSNIGQAMTAAYMFSHGGSGPWTGAGC